MKYELTEKPDGAKDVLAWEVNIERSYDIGPIIVEHADGTLTFERSTSLDEPSVIWLQINVRFYSDEAARDFENKVRALLPEVRQ